MRAACKVIDATGGHLQATHTHTHTHKHVQKRVNREEKNKTLPDWQPQQHSPFLLLRCCSPLQLLNTGQ